MLADCLRRGLPAVVQWDRYGNKFYLATETNYRHLAASQAKDQSLLSQCVPEDKAYCFMKNNRGSLPYYQLYNLLAMICQLGTHMVFHFVSCQSEMARHDSNNS